MEVMISSLALVESRARAFNPTAIISIVCPADDFPAFDEHEAVPIFRRKFDDICFELHSEHDKDKYSPPTIDLVLDILKFGEDNLTNDSRLISHCYAGISRSSAAAIIAMIPLLGAEDAVQQVSDLKIKLSDDKMRSGRQWLMPNNLMIEYADKILNFNGELVKLVNRSFDY